MHECREVRRQLARIGVLLLQDKRLPSVVGMFAQRPISTSWWSIPQAHDIFRCLESLDENQALATRLVSRKVTYVHNRLWPALAAVGAAQESWQTRGLSTAAKRLLDAIRRSDSPVVSGLTARDLQERLLAVAHEVHTANGRHEIRLESWDVWAARQHVTRLSSIADARRLIEDAAARLGAAASALPWYAVRRS